MQLNKNEARHKMGCDAMAAAQAAGVIGIAHGLNKMISEFLEVKVQPVLLALKLSNEGIMIA